MKIPEAAANHAGIAVFNIFILLGKSWALTVKLFGLSRFSVYLLCIHEGVTTCCDSNTRRENATWWVQQTGSAGGSDEQTFLHRPPGTLTVTGRCCCSLVGCFWPAKSGHKIFFVRRGHAHYLFAVPIELWFSRRRRCMWLPRDISFKARKIQIGGLNATKLHKGCNG